VSPPETRRGRPGQEAPSIKIATPSLIPLVDLESACDAYVVLVSTPTDKYRRRVFLSLHSATLAVQRAQAKGQPAQLVLCRLQPVTADLPSTLPLPPSRPNEPGWEALCNQP
jgi:hypothetical protein